MYSLLRNGSQLVKIMCLCHMMTAISHYLQGQLMDIKIPMADNSYMLKCWKSRTNPTFILNSSIFEDT